MKIMATTMTQTELDAFYEKLAEFTEHGTEAQTREYIEYHFPRLPEKVRHEVVFNALSDAVNEAVQGEDALIQTLEEGLTAGEELLKLKKQVLKEEKSENS